MKRQTGGALRGEEGRGRGRGEELNMMSRVVTR